MFTGIIEALGQLVEKRQQGGDLRLRLATGKMDMSDVKLGDSIATNGVCLTVTGLQDGSFWADVSNETIKHSSLNDLSIGSNVNLEKAMIANGRFGGHIVTGHVDAVAKIGKISKDARSIRLEVETPAECQRYIAHKGSITIDGVSLTVNALTPTGFLLNIVPHTADETIIASYKEGSRVNIEVDVIARYLEQLMQPTTAPSSSKIDTSFLAANGFIK
ncbi:MAG: riboflavin synthase [Pseudomonadales bacterium]|nr:riboflavin synthase [Pseudomonadales bacterium]